MNEVYIIIHVVKEWVDTKLTRLVEIRAGSRDFYFFFFL